MPMAVSVVTTTIIISKLYQHRRLRNTMNNWSQNASIYQDKTTYQLIFVSTCSLITYSMFVVRSALIMTHGSYKVIADEKEWIYYFMKTCYLLNSSVNFLGYWAINRQFRTYLKRALVCERFVYSPSLSSTSSSRPASQHPHMRMEVQHKRVRKW